MQILNRFFACCRRDPAHARRAGVGGRAGNGDCLEPRADSWVWEATGQETKENWKWVGRGKGGYEFVQTYNFVGKDNGSFVDAEHEDQEGCCWQCCRWGVCLLFLAAAVVLGAGLLKQQGVDLPLPSSLPLSLGALSSLAPAADLSVVSPGAPESVVEGPRHNCVTPWPPSKWLADKREWCCMNQQIGCKNGNEDEDEVLDPFDCEMKSLSDWLQAQVAWCCQNKQLGCSRMQELVNA